MRSGGQLDVALVRDILRRLTLHGTRAGLIAKMTNSSAGYGHSLLSYLSHDGPGNDERHTQANIRAFVKAVNVYMGSGRGCLDLSQATRSAVLGLPGCEHILEEHHLYLRNEQRAPLDALAQLGFNQDTHLWSVPPDVFQSLRSRTRRARIQLYQAYNTPPRGMRKDDRLRFGRSAALIADLCYAGCGSPAEHAELSSMAVEYLAPLAQLAGSDPVSRAATRLLGFAYQSQEGPSWNYIRHPNIDSKVATRVLHYLGLAESMYRRFVQMTMDNGDSEALILEAVRYEHCQVLCMARTWTQRGEFQRAMRELERARGMIGCNTPLSFVMQSLIHQSRGDTHSSVVALHNAMVGYSEESWKSEEMHDAVGAQLFYLTGDSGTRECARRFLRNKSGRIRAAYFCDASKIRSRLRNDPNC